MRRVRHLSQASVQPSIARLLELQPLYTKRQIFQLENRCYSSYVLLYEAEGCRARISRGEIRARVVIWEQAAPQRTQQVRRNRGLNMDESVPMEMFPSGKFLDDVTAPRIIGWFEY